MVSDYKWGSFLVLFEFILEKFFSGGAFGFRDRLRYYTLGVLPLFQKRLKLLYIFV